MRSSLGTLFVVAVPLGNGKDITKRALQVLSDVKVIACEDTRVTHRLLCYLGIDSKDKRFICAHEHNWGDSSFLVSGAAGIGEDVALVSDAGTPCISDPGSEIINMCHTHKIPVVPIPGCSAPVTALSISGFNLKNGFRFVGFIPSVSEAGSQMNRERIIRSIVSNTGVIVAFESPRRVLDLLDTLNRLINAMGQNGRRIFIGREISKKNEEFFRGTVDQCIHHFQSKEEVRGEFTIVFDESNSLNKLSSAKSSQSDEKLSDTIIDIISGERPELNTRVLRRKLLKLLK